MERLRQLRLNYVARLFEFFYNVPLLRNVGFKRFGALPRHSNAFFEPADFGITFCHPSA